MFSKHLLIGMAQVILLLKLVSIIPDPIHIMQAFIKLIRHLLQHMSATQIIQLFVQQMEVLFIIDDQISSFMQKLEQEFMI